MKNIILTADKSQMSNYRNNIYAGFITCLPMNFWSKSLYNHMIRQTYKEAPIGVRCAEASLLEAGMDVKVVHPDLLESTIDANTKIVGVSVVDPLGMSPASGMAKVFFGGEVFSSYEFRTLMEKLKILKEKYHFKTVVGGQGVWQLKNMMEDFGIDHLYYGESERTFPKFCREPENYEPAVHAELPKEDEIPPIRHAATLGAVEISRGCGRMCKFCSTTLYGKMRHIPGDVIMESVKTSVKEGQTTISLRSEDFLLYGDNKFIPDDEALLDLLKRIFSIRGVKSVYGVHASFASIAANQDLIEKITKSSKMNGHVFGCGCQPGIETGSDPLLTKLMPGKKIPFKNESWGDIIYNALKILNKNGWVSFSTLIIGLPEEEPEDVKETIGLVKNIRKFKNFVFPLLFIPVRTTPLADSKMLYRLTALRKQLLKECWKTNFIKFKYFLPQSVTRPWNFIFSILTLLGSQIIMIR